MDLEIVRLSLRYIHLLGTALLVGGVAVQLITHQYRINKAMVFGIITQLVTGLALAAPLDRDEDLSSAKLGVKLLLTVLLAVMVLVPRKKEHVAPGHMYGIAGMAALTVAVATFWT